MANWLARIFGSRNQRLVGQYSSIVKKINAMEPAMQALSDDDLKSKGIDLWPKVRTMIAA